MILWSKQYILILCMSSFVCLKHDFSALKSSTSLCLCLCLVTRWTLAKLPYLDILFPENFIENQERWLQWQPQHLEPLRREKRYFSVDYTFMRISDPLCPRWPKWRWPMAQWRWISSPGEPPLPGSGEASCVVYHTTQIWETSMSTESVGWAAAA